MIKIGCCTNMVAEDSAGIGIDRIEKLAELGYDYIELPLAQMMQLNDKDFAKLSTRVEQSGIPCLACNNFFPATMQLTGSETTPTDALKAYIEKALIRAEHIGAKSIVFGSAAAKNVPNGFPYETARNQIVAILKLVSDCIGEKNISIAIEPLNQRESNIIITASDGLALLKAVNRPNIRLLVDFYHMSLESEAVSIIPAAKDYLQHMHLANPNGRIWPKHNDGGNYDSFLRALKEAAYDGCVSIEAFSNHFYSDAKEGYETLQKIIRAF
ncbi:MAG: sugar phosphate isomerase/epimerase [Lachnospiraceae bacterium]|nr:sugar phosphate isomerase/epimerase [Lachnospiraceae bacterium]